MDTYGGWALPPAPVLPFEAPRFKPEFFFVAISQMKFWDLEWIGAFDLHFRSLESFYMTRTLSSHGTWSASATTS
jgi:hypothetical protein